MDFLINDLSLHGQFQDINSFLNAIARIMKIRGIARRFGRSLYCHKGIIDASVTVTMTMVQAVQQMTHNERRAFLQWLTQHGPFWEDVRNHGADDWFEHKGEIVTDTAVGEVAWCCSNGIQRGLVSFIPSDWQFSPVAVEWVIDDSTRETVHVENDWDPAFIETALQAAPVPLSSWEQVEDLAEARWPQLTFAGDTFAPLKGTPFVVGAAQRLVALLDILNRFRSCFDAEGNRTSEGHEMYKQFFTGKKEKGGHGALFSDSSDDEKDLFKKEMTFTHPSDAGKTLFCPWHGKVQTPQLRIHFSWPVPAEEPLYVVYVGPKITKR